MVVLIVLAALGVFALLANLVDAAGKVLVALIRYIGMPLFILFCIAYIAKYGLC